MGVISSADSGTVLGRPRWTVYGVGGVDLFAGVLASVLVFISVRAHLNADDPHGSVLAGVAAMSLTLPVVWARRAPSSAAVVVAVGSLVNWLAVGSYVRCAPSLPSAFWIAFVLGRRTRGRAALAGLALVLVDLEAQCLSDPRLGAAVIVGMGPIAIGCWLAGRAITGRAETMRRIELRNAEITRTRDQTAALAVAIDRERISAGIDGLLQRRISGMAATAAVARERLDEADPAAAFATIAQDGREALSEMRDVVGLLRSEAARQPQPGLDRLADLVGHRGGRLELAGQPRELPGGIEVSAYRIVEHLLALLAEASVLPSGVYVRFAVDELEIRVTGRSRPEAIGEPDLAVVRQRVAVHDGSLVADTHGGDVQWVARLPLPAGHV